jgi:hypothetical protein
LGDNFKVGMQFTADAAQAVSEIGRTETRIRHFGDGVRDGFSRVGKYIDAASEHIGWFGTAAAAITSGKILKDLFSIHDFIPFDKALVLMQSNLRLSAREATELKSAINHMSQESGQDLLKTYQAATKLSYMYGPKGLQQVLKASTYAAHGMGAPVDEVTARIVKMMKIFRQGPEAAQRIAEGLVASRADIETIDIMLERGVFKGSAGEDVQDFLALIGGLRKAGVEGTRAVTTAGGAMTALFSHMKEIRAEKIDLFKVDPKSGQKVKKSHIEILEDLNRLFKTKYKHLSQDEITQRLDKKLGVGSGEAIMFLLSQLDKLKSAQKDQENAAVIAAKRAAAASETWEHQLDRVKSTIDSIKLDFESLYNLAKKPLKLLADNPELTKGTMLSGAALATAAAAALAWSKGKSLIGAIRGTAAGNTAMGVGEGKIWEKMAGVTPVFVVNWPGGDNGIGNGPSSGPGTVPSGPATGAGGKIASGLGLSTLAKAGIIGTATAAALYGADLYKEGYEANWKDSVPSSQMDSMKEVLGGGHQRLSEEVSELERIRSEKKAVGSEIRVNLPVQIHNYPDKTIVNAPSGVTVAPELPRGHF